MLSNPDDMALVQAIIGMAHTFKRDVIAEGVESVEHGKALIELGCDLAQGYGIARPMPAAAFSAWVTEWSMPAVWRATAARQP
jgi:EAL domain-containing protein (putative c-di-GMP-specific phosphodiesterase class I)